MTSTEPFFNCPRRLSISMFRQNISQLDFQPNLLFSSQQTATESTAEEKKTRTKKKVGKSIGDPVRGRDAPIKEFLQITELFIL